MNALPEPEIFTPERIAEFLLNNALSEEAYAWAIQEVLAMGVDPSALDPESLDRTEPWARAELYLDQIRAYKRL